jgi:hypothetical protein
MINSIEIDENIHQNTHFSRIACYVPDVLLNWIPKLEIPSSKEFHGVVLFADVSGQ